MTTLDTASAVGAMSAEANVATTWTIWALGLLIILGAVWSRWPSVHIGWWCVLVGWISYLLWLLRGPLNINWNWVYP